MKETNMTKQEMFDRAWKGLKSQGFKRCMKPESGRACVYADGKGNHCAWGWVDPEGTVDKNGVPFNGGIAEIRHRSGTLAAEMFGDEDMNNPSALYAFAEQLQRCHDLSKNEKDMESTPRVFAMLWCIRIPYDKDEVQ
jgi:hypothetical protein